MVNEQSAITAVAAGTKIAVNGEIPPGSISSGDLEVSNGAAVGFDLVCNDGLVDDVELLIADDAVLQRNLRVFDGQIRLDPEDGGGLEAGEILGSDGQPVSGVLIMRGNAMQNGSPLTAWAFKEGLGGLAFGNGHLLVTLAVFLFGLSTAISWSYYGDRSILYLVGPRWVVPYRVVFCVAHFLGAVYSLELVWAFGDLALGLMTIPNLISILLLTGLVKGWVHEYVDEGKLEPPQR